MLSRTNKPASIYKYFHLNYSSKLLTLMLLTFWYTLETN